MGFYENDRIRNKNKKYNLPTPEINASARRIIKDLCFHGDQLIVHLNSLLNDNDGSHSHQVLTTAIIIAKTEYK